MENENLAIATVPVQPWGPLFTEDEALCTGTIFRDLEMSFFATEDLPSTKHAPATPASQEQAEREHLLGQIFLTSFYLDDLTLFLDTHPQDGDALKCFQEKNTQRKALKQQFAEKFYPLTRDCVCCLDKDTEFGWTKGHMPWEGACV